ncbi:hypothetical protein [Acinetobacter sp. YH16053]|uniref:hypothetical protein n=1 Tax=Acinetobacter sp. YH16053 TaxID=2601192 RepID=UPI0015D40312|nr:hypothetical protein [Acinetobacter sp. YH16053]
MSKNDCDLALLELELEKAKITAELNALKEASNVLNQIADLCDMMADLSDSLANSNDVSEQANEHLGNIKNYLEAWTKNVRDKSHRAQFNLTTNMSPDIVLHDSEQNAQ